MIFVSKHLILLYSNSIMHKYANNLPTIYCIVLSYISNTIIFIISFNERNFNEPFQYLEV